MLAKESPDHREGRGRELFHLLAPGGGSHNFLLQRPHLCAETSGGPGGGRQRWRVEIAQNRRSDLGSGLMVRSRPTPSAH